MQDGLSANPHAASQVGVQVPAQEEHLEADQAGGPDRLSSAEPGKELPGEERLHEEEQTRAEEGDAAESSHGMEDNGVF